MVVSPRLVAKMDKMIEKTFPNDANEDDDVSLTITCTMRKDCMRKFLSFLARIEYDGSIGHSEVIAFDADGDGTFRPEFVADALRGADVPTVIHGHWILQDDNKHSCCSNCKAKRNISTQIGWKYCPNCGAKMDENEKDNNNDEN